MESVSQWLDSLGLSQYTQSFEENEIQLEHLPELDHETLKELGVKALGHRLTLLKAARSLDDPPDDPPPPPNATAASAVEPERRQLTVMFCDLVGSVALGEQMELEDYRELLANFRQTAVTAVTQHNGYIARHQGDGLLVYFGYPAANDNDAERSVRAGLQIIAAAKKLNHTVDSQVSVRVGIATGMVVVGDVLATASSSKSEHAAFGTTPNLAARLQGQAAPDTLLISGTTKSLVENHFHLSEGRHLSLKGMSQPVWAFEVYRVQKSATVGRYGEVWTEDNSPLIGRDDELLEICRTWGRVCTGRGHTTFVASQPGLGKSRLIRALVAEVLEGDHHIFTLACSAFHENSTLFPLIDQLSHIARIAFGDSPQARRRKLSTLLRHYLNRSDAISSAVESLIDQACYTTDDNFQFARQSEQRLDGLVGILAELAVQKPVLLVVEDVQWADPSTLTLLDQFHHRITDLPVFLVITHRGYSELEFENHEQISRLTLQPLDQQQCKELIIATAKDVSLDQQTIDTIRKRSDGIPLYLKEITLEVVQAQQDAQRTNPEPASPQNVMASIPERLQDSLMARLDRLGQAKIIAQIGSVIGRQFEHGIIEAILARPESELHEMHHQLLSSELVTAQGTLPNAMYFFNHALVQEAAYQSLLKSVRTRYHACCAKVLVERFPHIAQTHPERIAQHYTNATMATEAVEYWSIASRRALSRSAYQESRKSAQRGMELLGQIDNRQISQGLEINLRNTIGHATDMSAGFGRSEVSRSFERARQLCHLTANDAELFLTLLGMWRGTIASANLTQSQEVAQQLLQAAQTLSGPVPRIVARMTLANTYFHVGQFDNALAQVNEGLAIYHPEQRNEIGAPMFMVGQDPVVSLLYCGALSSWLLGRHKEARDFNDRGLALARELNQPYSLSMALVWSSILNQFSQEHRESIELTNELVELSESYNLPWSLGLGLSIRGWMKLKNGAPHEGMQEIRRGIDILEAMEESSFSYYAFGLMADGHRILGNVSEGLDTVKRSIDWFTSSGMNWDAPYMLRLQARLALMKNDISLAEQSLQQSISYSRRMCMTIHEVDATLLLSDVLRSNYRYAEAIKILKSCTLPDERDHKAKVHLVRQKLAELQHMKSDNPPD